MNCYFLYNDNDLQDHTTTGPCTKPGDNSVVQCCNVGDYCLSNGVCQSGPGITTGDGISGYYMAGCTDDTFRDAACQTNCTAQGNSDIVYDWSAGAWRCCGNDSSGYRNCSTPQGGPMVAPPPQALEYVATVVDTGSMMPLETRPAVKTSSSNSSNSSDSSDSSDSSNSSNSVSTQQTTSPATSLSPGVAAGIAIAALIGLLILIAIPLAIIWRRRRKSRMQQLQNPQISQPMYPTTAFAAKDGAGFGPPSSTQDYYAQDRSELKAQKDRSELKGQGRSELKGSIQPAARKGQHELEHPSSTTWRPFPSELGTDNRI